MRAVVILLFIFSSFLLKAQCSQPLELGADTAICDAASFDIDAGVGFIDYLWNSGQSTQILNVTNTGTYKVTVHYLDPTNLVLNGDFSQGNTGFASSYLVGTGGSWGLLSNEGTYAISTNANLTHVNFVNCTDHTTGTGNMMVINGAAAANQSVWSQVVNVTPFTDYDFSAWFTSVHSSNPASLSFAINGVPIGNAVNLSSATCNWQNFAASWNSGASVSATISITNQNTGGSGNDFAIDDIYFAKYCELTDSIIVSFDNTPIISLGNDTSFCVGDTLLLSPYNGIANFHWSTGQTSASIKVASTGTYWVSVSSVFCSATDTIDVIVNDYPIVQLGNDTLLCDNNSFTLDVSNPNASYHWFDLSSNPIYNVSTAGVYWVDVLIGTCKSSDTIIVSTENSPNLSLGPDLDLCAGDNIFLNASNAGCNYLWNTGNTDSIQLVDKSGLYRVVVSNICGIETDSVLVNISKCDCELYVPTAFTPNNDGLNDEFLPIYNCRLIKSELFVFNRWGKLIFSAKDPLKGWDGSYKGKEVMQGVYSWLIEYDALIKNESKKFYKRGTLTLLR